MKKANVGRLLAKARRTMSSLLSNADSNRRDGELSRLLRLIDELEDLSFKDREFQWKRIMEVMIVLVNLVSAFIKLRNL